MKKKLVLASKVLFGVFLLLVFIVAMGMAYQEEGVENSWWAAAMLIAAVECVLMAISFLAVFIMEMQERWKDKKQQAVLEILLQSVTVFLVVAACDMFMFKEEFSPRRYAAATIGVLVMSKVLDYWKRAKKWE